MSDAMNTNPDLPRANPMIWLAGELVSAVDQGVDFDLPWVVDRMENGAATEVLAKLPREPLGIMNVIDKTQVNSAVQDFAEVYNVRDKTGVTNSGGLLLAQVLLAIAMQQTSSQPPSEGL